MTRSLRLCAVLFLFALPSFVAPASASPPGKGQANATPPSCTRPTLTEIDTGSGRATGRLPKGAVDEPRSVYLGQWLSLRGCGFEKLLTDNPGKPLQLYLNGMPVEGARHSLIYDQEKISAVRFELVRTEDSKDTWAALLGRPKLRPARVDVSLGVKGCNGCKDMSNALQIDLITLRQGWLAFYLAMMVAFLVVLLWLARTRGMLRDHGPGSPWSLARTQMAWWTFFVVCAFLFIWMVSGSYSSLSNSVLALIGISTGTAFLGAVIDDTKQNQAQQRAALMAEKQALQSRAPALAPAEVQRLADLDRQIQGLPDLVRQTPRSFLYDILSDEDGVSFHRFQMVIWTIVLTSIFIIRVYSTLAMPEFDAALLGLTGISAGTYLGFKFPEKKA
jgi:hypothetical protein